MDYLGFKFIYALIVMSMMKPAEKFLRNLFGMDRGKIANTASFESGKALMDATAKFVKDAAAVVATVATGGATALFSQKGIESLMNLKGGADGVTNSLSAGVADAGAKDGFFSEQIKELSKKGTEDKIENMTTGKNSKAPIEAIKKDLIASGRFGTTEDELRAAEEAAKSKWKSLVTKYAPYGYTDYDTLKEFDKISKETGITKPEKVIQEFRNGMFAREQKRRMEEQSRREQESIANNLTDDLKDKLRDNGGSYNIVDNDGNEIKVTYDSLLAGDVDYIIRQKARYIYECGDNTVKDWEKLNRKARNNNYIFDNLKSKLIEEMNLRGGTYDITNEDGNILKVNDSNVNSNEVKKAIMSKFKYIDDNIDKLDYIMQHNDLDKVNFDNLNELDRTSALLRKNGVGIDNISDLNKFNDIINEYKGMDSEIDRYNKALVDPRLNDRTRKVMGLEVKARNASEKKIANNEVILNHLVDNLKRKVDGGKIYKSSFNENDQYIFDKSLKEELEEAVKSRMKYIEGIDDSNFILTDDKIKNIDFDELYRLDRTRKSLEKHTGKVVDISRVKSFDKSIEAYIKSSEDKQNDILERLNKDLQDVLKEEVKARRP